jgi:phage terminase large subunit
MTLATPVRVTIPERWTRVDTRLRRAIESGTLPKELLICGPAGTGKTFGILSFLHIIAADFPGVRQLWCRKTRVALTESVLERFEREVLPADGMQHLARGARRNHRSSYIYPNGSEIVLAGTDDPERIGSTTWDLIYINEAIELEEEMWETLGARLDRPGSDPRFGYLIADTNPGDPSH